MSASVDLPKPNPGSREAYRMGCTCPVIDNEYGRGYMGGPDFVIHCDCPLHGEPPKVIA